MDKFEKDALKIINIEDSSYENISDNSFILHENNIDGFLESIKASQGCRQTKHDIVLEKSKQAFIRWQHIVDNDPKLKY